MYDFVSLNLKCPVCGVSLMNKEITVDNKPSIHLDVIMEGQKGSVYLSSIYGSYNFSCNVNLIQGIIAEFYCPHCHNEIISKSECLSCGAPMIPLYLDMGGKVSICSRSGCKNHFVEFEDLTQAMQKLYEDYGYDDSGNQRPPDIPLSKKAPPPDEKKEILQTGTFLHAYCPHCKRSLIENDMLKLRVMEGNETGILYMSPYLNVFTTKSTIFLPEDEVIDNIMCDHCGQSILEKEKTCEICHSPIGKIQVSARTRLVDFYLCTKKGCRWHGLSEEDMFDIKLEDTLDW
ncbi:MAG: hypothetical protein AB9842_00980 [Bacteroidales bacterium]